MIGGYQYNIEQVLKFYEFCDCKNIFTYSYNIMFIKIVLDNMLKSVNKELLCVILLGKIKFLHLKNNAIYYFF